MLKLSLKQGQYVNIGDDSIQGISNLSGHSVPRVLIAAPAAVHQVLSLFQ